MRLTTILRTEDRRKQVAIITILVVALCTAGIGLVAAQSNDEQTYRDDFEDGDASDWVNNETGVSAITSPTAIDETTSLYVNTSMVSQATGTASVDWQNGPELDTREDFEVSGIIQPDNDNGAGIRIGVSGEDQQAEGQNAFLIFEQDETFLATASDQTTAEDTLSDFDETWIHFRIQSNEGSETLRAKIWEYGTTEPDQWQLTRDDFDDVQPGPFGVNPGFSPGSGNRQIYLDSVQITGTPFVADESENLELDAPTLVQPGDSGSYTVRYYGPNNRSQIVTGEANVTSGNSSILAVNSSTHELEASEDTNVSQRITVTATYNGSTSTADVAVATVETENLDVLPTLWRFTALINDGTVFALILCTLFAVVATWAATPFAGIGAFQLGVAMGWFGGWIPGGIMMVGVFASLFIGFNLAANIDYTVRR